MSLGSVYNKRVPSTVGGDDDDVRFEVIIRARDHPANVDGYQNYVSSGFKYNPTKIWVGQLQVISAVPGPAISNVSYTNRNTGGYAPPPPPR